MRISDWSSDVCSSDLLIGALPLALGAEALHPLDQHPAVPASVEDRDVAPGGQARPEAPEEMPVALLLGRGGDGMDLVLARVPLRGHALADAALARRIPSLQQDHAAPVVADVRALSLGVPLPPLATPP